MSGGYKVVTTNLDTHTHTRARVAAHVYLVHCQESAAGGMRRRARVSSARRIREIRRRNTVDYYYYYLASRERKMCGGHFAEIALQKG